MNWKPLDEDARPVLGAANDWLDGFGLEGIHGADIEFATKKGEFGSGVHFFSWPPCNNERHIVAVTWYTCCDVHQHVIEEVTLTKQRV